MFIDGDKRTTVELDAVAGRRFVWEEKGTCANYPYFLLSVSVDVKYL